jgi:hypothetical protein
MSTPTPLPVVQNVTTPGSQHNTSSPPPVVNHHQSPQIPISHHQRKEVAVVFVVDGSARMKPFFNILYESYVEPIIK